MGSLDFVRTGLSNMHHCCAFPFALTGLFLLVINSNIGRIYHRLRDTATYSFKHPFKIAAKPL